MRADPPAPYMALHSYAVGQVITHRHVSSEAGNVPRNIYIYIYI